MTFADIRYLTIHERPLADKRHLFLDYEEANGHMKRP
jgi:hypothetical protein